MKEKQNIVVNKKDIIWNYLATFLQIGSGVLLFPVILRTLPSTTIGIWSIFMAISTLINLLDFGFSSSFTRNITYIFSGVNQLVKNGISSHIQSSSINISLLKNTIKAMQWFYGRIALTAFILLILFGSPYLYHLVSQQPSLDQNEIFWSWVIFCIVNTYNIYTLYYDALLQGRGFIMKDKQLIIISQLTYLAFSLVFIYLKMGLISIVLSQGLATLVRRSLSYHFFYTNDIKQKLDETNSTNFKEIVKILSPNSIKIGLTSIGAFLVLQSSVLIGSLYISLIDLASYGITIQIINVIASLAGVYFNSYTPRVAHLRVHNNTREIKHIFFRSSILLLLTFIICGSILLLAGNWALTLLKSKTLLLGKSMIIVLLIINFLEKNHAIAGAFLLSKNEVPYFKAAILSGICTVILLLIFVHWLHWGIWGMILAPGITQLVYQNWKWPVVLLNELNANN